MDELQRRYWLGGLGSIRILRDGSVAIEVGNRTQNLPMDRFQFLLQFAGGRTLAEVKEFLLDAPVNIVTSIVQDFERRGLVRAVGDSSTAPAGSLVDYLHPRYRSQAALETIGHHLSAGRCVILENAIEPQFAERVHHSLASYDHWRLDHDYASATFSYRHHKILDTEPLPGALGDCGAVLGSSTTKALIADLSNRDCSGDLSFGASLYLPGDYALPHSDASGTRNVTMNWYLTREWSPLWGGQLHWCPSWQSLEPAFNTMVLFNVTPEFRHFVSHVKPTASGRRFTVNAWWLASTSDSAWKPVVAPSRYSQVVAGQLPGLSVLG